LKETKKPNHFQGGGLEKAEKAIKIGAVPDGTEERL